MRAGAAGLRGATSPGDRPQLSGTTARHRQTLQSASPCLTYRNDRSVPGDGVGAPHDRIRSVAGSTACALRSSASAFARAWAWSHGVRDACGEGHQIREEIEQRHAREIAEEVAALQDKVDAERNIRSTLCLPGFDARLWVHGLRESPVGEERSQDVCRIRAQIRSGNSGQRLLSPRDDSIYLCGERCL